MFYNLTHPQKRIWYNEKIHGPTSMHNLLGLVRIEQEIDFNKLKEAINIFLKENDGVRIRVTEKNGEPIQIFEEYQKVDIDFFDFSKRDNPSRYFEDWLDELSSKCFPTLHTNLYYFAMFKLGAGQVGYIGKFHHIIADGWALKIAAEQISHYYTLISNSEPLNLENFSYQDIIKKEPSYLQSQRFIKNKNFWHDTFRSLPPNMPAGHNMNLKAHRKSFLIDEKTSMGIRNYVKKNKWTINALFVSSFLIYLYLTERENDLVLGTPVLNRSGKKEKNTFGMFTSTMPFRMYLEENVEVYQFIQETSRQLKKFYFHHKYPYDLLVSDLELSKKGYDGLFDICVNYYNTIFNHLFDGRPYKTYEVFNGNQPYKLQLVISEWDRDGKIKLDFDYKTANFSDIHIEKMFRHILNIIQFIMKFPQKKIFEIDMLSLEEKNELIYGLNTTHSDYPSSKIITQLFEEQVLKNTDRIACYFENESITYVELNASANKLARFLKSKGIGKEKVVGIAAEHSLELIVAILAVLKSGGGYLPLDPRLPVERMNFMLEDSGALLLLKYGSLSSGISFQGESYCLDDESIYAEDGSNIEVDSGPENLAYIMYTSGSTGKPKGVMVLHQGLVNYIFWASKTYFSKEPEIFAMYSSISFDLTVTSIFTPLISGNQMMIYRDDHSEFPLFKALNDQKSTIVKLTPSHLSLIHEARINSSRVRKFIVGGEDLKGSLAQKIYESFNGKIEIYNEYGPTEAVVGCMIHQYHFSDDLKGSVPIGVPADNVAIYILDPYLNPVPFNVKGEIYVSGVGVSRGYINREQLTKEKFIDNPYIPGATLYKTGDLGMWLEDGTVQYIGRKDNQVKINGYRIELGEIESVLSTYPDIIDCVVNVIENTNGRHYLCAYYLSYQEVPEKALRAYLYARLPEYMVPREIMYMNSFPLTNNGKVDKKSLPFPHFPKLSITKYEGSRDHLENILVDVWREIFASKEIGIYDDFFALGGDSIKAIQLMSKLITHDIEVSVQDIMTYRSISELAKHTRTRSTSYDQGLISGEIHPTPILSWFVHNNFNNIHYYNQSVLLTFKKEIDIPILEKAFKKIIEHHDALRINMKSGNEMYYNNSLLQHDFKIAQYHVFTIDAKSREEERKPLLHNMKSNFNLYKKLPLQAAVINHENGNKELVITAHHLVIDGISWTIILDDLFHAYRCLYEGKDCSMPQKTASFQQFSEEIHRYSQSSEVLDERGFWEEMEGASATLPVEDASRSVTHSSSECMEFFLDRSRTEKLLEGTRNTHAQTIDLLLTALALSVRDWAGFTDFTYEIENHGRHLENIDVSRTIGWFTVLHPLRIKIKEENISKVISSVKEQRRRVPKKGIGYGILRYSLQKMNADNKGSEIRFNYLGHFNHENQYADYSFVHDKYGRDVDPSNHLTTKIEINGMIINHRLGISFRYSREWFSRATITKFVDIYLMNLNRVIDSSVSNGDTHFTPSDFELANVSQEDIDLLFE